MIIYLDESGNLGFDFSRRKTNRYLVIGLLIFLDEITHECMVRAVKKTLKNKLSKGIQELKGSSLGLSVKRYFLKELNKQQKWRLYVAIADKKSWAECYISKHRRKPDGKVIYNELARRLLAQVDYLQAVRYVDITIDRSKSKGEIAVFDEVITAEIKKLVSKKTQIKIKHRDSKGDAGLQAIDMFCCGIGRKYEFSDEAWYKEFSDKIIVEATYKF